MNSVNLGWMFAKSSYARVPNLARVTKTKETKKMPLFYVRKQFFGWSFQNLLALISLLPLPPFFFFFLPQTNSSPAVFHSRMLFSLPPCSPALCRLFWSGREPCGFPQGSEKGSPTVREWPAVGFAHAATCLSLICVNGGSVTVLAPHHRDFRSPTLSLVHRRPLAHTPERDEANTQTCGRPKRMGAGWKREREGGGVRSTPRRLTAIIRNKSRSPAATSPPLPHTSHYRGLFLSLNPAPAGVCLVGRKAHVMGRESIAGPGVTQSERQAAKRWKISLSNRQLKIKPLRGVVGVFAAVPIEEFFCRLVSFSPSFLPVLHAPREQGPEFPHLEGRSRWSKRI